MNSSFVVNDARQSRLDIVTRMRDDDKHFAFCNRIPQRIIALIKVLKQSIESIWIAASSGNHLYLIVWKPWTRNVGYDERRGSRIGPAISISTKSRRRANKDIFNLTCLLSSFSICLHVFSLPFRPQVVLRAGCGKTVHACPVFVLTVIYHGSVQYF